MNRISNKQAQTLLLGLTFSMIDILIVFDSSINRMCLGCQGSTCKKERYQLPAATARTITNTGKDSAAAEVASAVVISIT